MHRPAPAPARHRGQRALSSAHPDPGPIAIETETLRSGRSATQVRARMTQGEVACVEALITASRLEADTRPYWDAGLPEVSPVGWDECERLVPVLPTGQPVAIMDQVEVRLEPATRGFTEWPAERPG